MEQPWFRSFRADGLAVPIADRHYNRQKVGAPQFVPPGACLVFRTEDYGALWVTSAPLPEYVKHAWPGAWINSTFRREHGPLASDLIRCAVAATLAEWAPPPEGMVTFVDASKVRSTNPGYCYEQAGFRRCGETKGGLLAWQLLPADMPEPDPARHAALTLI